MSIFWQFIYRIGSPFTKKYDRTSRTAADAPAPSQPPSVRRVKAIDFGDFKFFRLFIF
jgi:hypothetical protein